MFDDCSAVYRAHFVELTQLCSIASNFWMKHLSVEKVSKAFKTGTMDPPSGESSDSERDRERDKKRKESSGSKPADEVEPLTSEEQYKSFFDAVNEQKAKVAAERPPTLDPFDFKVEPIGTEYTWEHKKIGTDIVVCEAQHVDAKDLCRLFFKNRMVSYSTIDGSPLKKRHTWALCGVIR